MDTQKTGGSKKVLKIICLVLAVVLGGTLIAGAAGYFYIDSAIDTGDAGELTDQVVTTAPELKADSVSYLVCGIDYEDEREYSDGLGMTDVIMYVSVDVKAGKINILQIPRDSYMGAEVPTGGTGKINGVYIHGEDKENHISNLAKVINEQFGLPVDHFVTIDMEMFLQVFKILGGIEMYVPWDVKDEEGNVIPEGTHFLGPDHIEWLLRQRKGYAQGDLKRLELQQYFYKAVFNTFKSFPMSDIIKVMPTFITYVNTDMSVADMLSLASTVMTMDSSGIGFARCPGGSINRPNAVTGKNESCYGINVENLAVLLNEHFRPYAEPVEAAQLGLPVIPDSDFTLGQINDGLAPMGGLAAPAA